MSKNPHLNTQNNCKDESFSLVFCPLNVPYHSSDCNESLVSCCAHLESEVLDGRGTDMWIKFANFSTRFREKITQVFSTLFVKVVYSSLWLRKG